MDKVTVLIVEDETIVATDLAAKLSMQGYEVVGIAADGEEAVGMALSRRPQVILMDIRLRGAMDGIDAAEAIRRQADVPVIYLTAHSDIATLARAKLSEPCGYILKPFDTRDLATTIEIALYKHQAVQNLRDSEERLRLLVEGVKDYALIMLDVNGNVASWNEGARRLKGWEAEEILGAHFSRFYPQDAVTAGLPEKELQIAAQEGIYKEEGVRQRKDGTRFCAEVSITAIMDQNNNLRGYAKITHDITERKRADESLRRYYDELEKRVEERTSELEVANAYNRSLIEASLDPLATIGRDGKITDVNIAAETATGHSRDELIGTDFCDYFSEPEKARAGYQQVFREGAVRDYPLELRHRDGHLTSVLYNASVYRDEEGKAIGVFAAARDITERKRAEALTIRNNAILNAINQVFLEAFSCETEEALCKRCLHITEKLTGSRFGIIAELNPAGRLDTIALSDPGWSACRMPKTDAVISLKDLPVRGLFASVVRGGDSVVINDPQKAPDRVGTPEGHPPLACFLGIPLKQGKKTIGLIGLANKDGGYNSSDREAVEAMGMAAVEALMRLRAEMGVRLMNAELELRVQNRTSELEAANRELESFAYSVSHDLRAPLRSINGFSNLLRDEYRDKLDAEGKDCIERIITATRRMGQLIDDLLNLAGMTRVEMRRERVDLSKNFRKIADGLKKAHPERQVEWIIADDLHAYGDEQLLTVMLENLINNSWKFTEETPRAKVEFGMTRRENQPVFFIRDNGAGFDMDYAGKLFKPFQRLHHIDQFPGTGIGLATVKRIIDRHGGRIWAEGEVGKGATFYFAL